MAQSKGGGAIVIGTKLALIIECPVVAISGNRVEVTVPDCRGNIELSAANAVPTKAELVGDTGYAYHPDAVLPSST